MISLHVEPETPEVMGTENRLVVAKGEGEKWVTVVQRYKLAVVSPEYATYSIESIVNNNELYICKLLRQIFKILITRKKL